MGKTKEPKLPKVKTQKYEDRLRCVLTPEEISDRADRAACLIEERDGKEEAAKAAAKHAKSEIEKIDAEIRHLSNEVRTRATYRRVECERRFDYSALNVRETRLDTGELLNDRKMTEAEKQRELFEDQDTDEDEQTEEESNG